MSGHPGQVLRNEHNGPGNYWIDKPFTLSGLAATLRDASAGRPVPKG
jgi:hypothetical protein